MGCTSSKKHQSYQCHTQQQPPTLLAGAGKPTGAKGGGNAGKRLTVNGQAAAGTAPAEKVNFTEEEIALEQMDILTLLKKEVTSPAAKCAVFSSKLDPNMKESFKNKLVLSRGTMDKTVGFACKKGLKPKSPNQDAWAVIHAGEDFSIYMVCDGHGSDGHLISDLAINMIPKFILSNVDFKNDLKGVLEKTFKKMHEFIVKAAQASGFDADLSGSTCTVVFHNKIQQKLTVAHVGDSGSCIGKRTQGSSQLSAKVLLVDHKPEDPEERVRIEARGGRVEWDGYANHRVYGGQTESPGMNMSRALGDDLGHRIAGITYEPTINEYQLESDDQFVCVCSDGVWEFLKPEEVVSILDSGKTLQDGCEKVTKKAWDCWIREERGEVVDDITAILIKLPKV